MINLGDLKLGQTVDFKFITTSSAGAPTQLAGSPVISVYVGNSTTQITAGITLTVDFDSVTGLNNCRLALTSGNGYASLTDCTAVITTGTVGGNSVVGYPVAYFSIDNRYGLGTGIAATGTLSGTHSTTTADLGTNAPSQDVTGMTLFLPGVNVARQISSYNTSTGVATWTDALTSAPTDGLYWALFASAPASGGTWPSEAEIAAEVLASTVETGATVKQSLMLANAALGGKASGLDTTSVAYRDLNDTKNRIAATVDANGNRLSITRDLT